jgi:hypothetical protein
MPKIVTTLEFAAQTKDKTWEMMTRIYEQLARVVNGKISFGIGSNLPFNPVATRDFSDNIDCAWIEVQFTAAATDLTITHNLGRLLSAYVVCRKSTPVDIYDSPTMNATPNWVATHGKTQYILRATAIADAVLLLF